MKSVMRHLALVFPLAIAVCLGNGQSPASQGLEPTAAEILGRAFERRYGCDVGMTLTLNRSNRYGEEISRRVEVAIKWIRGRRYVLARITDPPFLRGTALLTIDNEHRGEEHFVFLPSVGRARRMTTPQGADSFLGTDLSYEDVRRQTVHDYDIGHHRAEYMQGDAVYVVVARPRVSSIYGRVVFYVSASDYAIRKTDYFSSDTEELLKTIEAEGKETWSNRPCQIPMRIVAYDRRRGTRTELKVQRLVMDLRLEDSLFSIRSLESERQIPIR